MKHKVFRNFWFESFADRVPVKDVSRVFNELYQTRWRLAELDEVKFFLENNNVGLNVRKKLLVSFLEAVGEPVSDFTLVCLFYLMDDNLISRIGYFINVLKIFYAQERDLMLVEVISRFDLGGTNLQVYQASLEYLYQKKVEYIFKKDDSLVGGFRLRWYNGELDLTIRHQIDQVEKTILQGR
jgi:F0F1-type ATP synthase delta subunit